jgi:tetratricopeptide (TPR) repeat protein
VTAAPGETLPDPKDKREVLERYRAAIDLAGDHQWNKAIGLVQRILKDDPEMTDVWNELATLAIRADRQELAVDAYKHVIELAPSDPAAYIGAANTYLRQRRFDDARAHAELVLQVAPERDVRSRGAAHELLAKIALARHDAAAARREAAFAHEVDPALPLPAYIDARLLYDEGEYADALPLFEQAIAAVSKPRAVQMPELHFYAADTLARLERYPAAEKEFLEELRYFPQNTRARAGLAMLYQATDRADRAASTIDDLMRITPTPAAYALAAWLWTMFGNPEQANAVRAEARRAFTDPARGGARVPRQ